jgi:hypothetical protein
MIGAEAGSSHPAIPLPAARQNQAARISATLLLPVLSADPLAGIVSVVVIQLSHCKAALKNAT